LFTQDDILLCRYVRVRKELALSLRDWVGPGAIENSHFYTDTESYTPTNALLYTIKY